MSGQNTIENEEDEGVTPKNVSWLRRILILASLIMLALTYPIAIVINHKVTNTVPVSVPNQVWADPKVGTAIEILERELFFGWAPNKPRWHPQAQLTAMPAYQLGISDLLSQFAARRADARSDSGRDRDLWTVHTLLAALNEEDAEDRIRAAIEAFRRYDGLKARAVLDRDEPQALLLRDIAVFRVELGAAIDSLRELAGRPSRGVFNRNDVRVYYRAKGKIHAIAMLLKASRASDVDAEGVASALSTANVAFGRASIPAPLTVSNPQPGTFSFGANDVMELAFLAIEADRALLALEDTIRGEANQT